MLAAVSRSVGIARTIGAGAKCKDAMGRRNPASFFCTLLCPSSTIRRAANGSCNHRHDNRIAQAIVRRLFQFKLAICKHARQPAGGKPPAYMLESRRGSADLETVESLRTRCATAPASGAGRGDHRQFWTAAARMVARFAASAPDWQTRLPPNSSSTSTDGGAGLARPSGQPTASCSDAHGLRQTTYIRMRGECPTSAVTRPTSRPSNSQTG
jgi:hypothetical protein